MPTGLRPIFLAALLFATAGAMAVSAATPPPGKPTGKFYVAAVSGTAEIYLKDGSISSLALKAVYVADGAEIVTGANSSVTLVFSNSTSVTCDEDTKLHVLKFSQDPLKPNVTDLEQEPSASQMQVFIDRGKVSVTTPNLAAGSSCTFFTAQGQISIRDVQAVIGVHPTETVVSMLAGNASARTETLDGGVQLQQGEQVILSNQISGQTIPLQVSAIPAAQMAQLTDFAAATNMARNSVYFAPVAPGLASPTLTGSAVTAATNAKSADSSGSTGTGSVFEDTSSSSPTQVLQPVPLVPVNLPPQFIISPARIGG